MCLLQKGVLSQTVWDSVLGYSSAEIIASEMRKLAVYTYYSMSKPKVNTYQMNAPATGSALNVHPSLSTASLDTRDYGMCVEVKKVLTIQYKTMQGISS